MDFKLTVNGCTTICQLVICFSLVLSRQGRLPTVVYRSFLYTDLYNDLISGFYICLFNEIFLPSTVTLLNIQNISGSRDFVLCKHLY